MTGLWVIVMTILMSGARPASGKSWKELELQNGCSISRPDLSRGKRFPGNFCIFLPDGSFISAGNESLRRIGPEGGIIWEKPVRIHHQLNLSADGKRILALGSEVFGVGEKQRRLDTFHIFNLDGKELHRRSAESVLAENKVPELKKILLPPTQKFHGVKEEGSHFNSITEIPAQKTKQGHPSLREGNVIVNGLEKGIFVLTPDLQKNLAHFLIPESRGHIVHDVQVTPEGKLLFFNNYVLDPENNLPYSRVQTWDPVKRKTGISIGPSPKEYFYSPASGSVQQLEDGTLMFTHMFTGGFFTNEKGRVLGTFFGGVGDPPILTPFLHVRSLDLTEFLKKNLHPSKL